MNYSVREGSNTDRFDFFHIINLEKMVDFYESMGFDIGSFLGILLYIIKTCLMDIRLNEMI